MSQGSLSDLDSKKCPEDWCFTFVGFREVYVVSILTCADQG